MSKTVLIADDIAFVRNVLKEILTQAGFTVVGEAKNGEEAYQMFRKYKPDLVTMDIVMPKISGIEATRMILKEEKSAKVIVLTSMAQEQLITDAIHAGARDYIVKPFQKAEVLRVIAQLGFDGIDTDFGENRARA